MKFTIPISKISPNPNAGRTYKEIPIYPAEWTIKSNITLDIKGFQLSSYKDNIYTYVGFKQPETLPIGFKGTVENKARFEKIHWLCPEGKYNIEYDYKVEVQCENCLAKFAAEELESDEIFDIWSDNVCPRCEYFDCCEIELEKEAEFKERADEQNF